MKEALYGIATGVITAVLIIIAQCVERSQR